MKITYRGDYALKAVLDLSIHYGEGLVTIQELATHIDAPTKFLEQVLLELKRGGFVESKRGKIGGYVLAKSPAQIRLGDVIRFIDGPIEPISCCEHGYSGCKDIYRCIFREMWQRITLATSDIIDGITFEDLVNRLKTQEKAIAYQI